MQSNQQDSPSVVLLTCTVVYTLVLAVVAVDHSQQGNPLEAVRTYIEGYTSFAVVVVAGHS